MLRWSLAAYEVPQIARIKLIHKKFTDQVDPHVDFVPSDQVDAYGSSRSVTLLWIKLIRKHQLDSKA